MVLFAARWPAPLPRMLPAVQAGLYPDLQFWSSLYLLPLRAETEPGKVVETYITVHMWWCVRHSCVVLRPAQQMLHGLDAGTDAAPQPTQMGAGPMALRCCRHLPMYAQVFGVIN